MPQIMQSHLVVAEEPLVALSVGDAVGQDMGWTIGGSALLAHCLAQICPVPTNTSFPKHS